MECLFCSIINKETPNFKIYEDEDVYAFLDINPKSYGHTIVVPKKHIKNMNDYSKLNYDFLKKVKEIANLLQIKLGFNDYQIVCNNGELAGQVVFHLHIHIIPSYENCKYKNDDFEIIMNLVE